ncbi:MAG: hypothetical protein P8Y29_00570 [Gemmatimonadota bacterium]
MRFVYATAAVCTAVALTATVAPAQDAAQIIQKALQVYEDGAKDTDNYRMKATTMGFESTTLTGSVRSPTEPSTTVRRTSTVAAAMSFRSITSKASTSAPECSQTVSFSLPGCRWHSIRRDPSPGACE